MRRRSVLVSGLTSAFASAFALGRPTMAQEATPDALAGHPLVGTWAVMTPGGVVPQIHGPDGSIIAAFSPNYVDPTLGLTFQGPALGRWESTGARSGHFTVIQALSDANGVYIGTFQFEADPEVSADGQTLKVRFELFPADHAPRWIATSEVVPEAVTSESLYSGSGCTAGM
jgi:hypothetical protein